MKVKFRYIDSKRFYHKTADQDYIILFRKDAMNLMDNQCDKICDEIINVVKKDGVYLFVSDIVEKLEYPDEICSLLKESLFIYAAGYQPIVAGEIFIDGYKLLYKETIVAELECVQTNHINKSILGLLLLTIIFFAYYFSYDNYRRKDNLTDYKRDCNILDSLSNYLVNSTDKSSFSYAKYIASGNLSGIENTIDSLHQCADSCFNATKDKGRYIPLVFDKSLVMSSIHKLIIESKELEKVTIETKRRGANDMMYANDSLLISSLKEYLEIKTSCNVDYAKYINYKQVNNIELILDSLLLEAELKHTEVLDSGKYIKVSVDTFAIKAEINEIVLSAKELLSKEIQPNETKTPPETSRKGTKAPSTVRAMDSSEHGSSQIEKKFFEYKKCGDEAYMSYYNSGLEKYRLKAIEQYNKALLLKNDNTIIKRLIQLNK